MQCPLRSSSRITSYVRVALHAPDFLPAPAPSHLLSLLTVLQHVYTILPRGSCSNNINALHSCMCVYGDKCHRTHVLAKPFFESSNRMEPACPFVHMYALYFALFGVWLCRELHFSCDYSCDSLCDTCISSLLQTNQVPQSNQTGGSARGNWALNHRVCT